LTRSAEAAFTIIRRISANSFFEIRTSVIWNETVRAADDFRADPNRRWVVVTSPPLRPKTQRFIEKRLAEENAPVFEVQLVDREAYRAMLSFGGTVAGLAGKGSAASRPATVRIVTYRAQTLSRSL